MKTPVKYLLNRVAEVNPASAKKVSEGARLLRLWSWWDDEEKLQMLLDHSWQLIQQRCSQKTEHKLTALSLTLGEKIQSLIEEDHLEDLSEKNPHTAFSLGDLMLETFLQVDMIDIHRAYAGWRAPYLVSLKNHGHVAPVLLVGTVFARPEPVSSSRSPITGDRYVKSELKSEEFLKHIEENRTYIQALNKARMQGWRLNLAVLALLKETPPPTSLPLKNQKGGKLVLDIRDIPDKVPAGYMHEDGTKFLGLLKDSRLQRLRSRYYEYCQIIRKADLLLAAYEKRNIDPAEGVFWQEAFLDYRGRLYYSEPFLNYQSSDMARALFLFEEGETLKKADHDVFLIHTANCLNTSISLDDLQTFRHPLRKYAEYLKEEKMDAISLDKLSLVDRAKCMQSYLANLSIEEIKSGWIPTAEKPYSLAAGIFAIDSLENHLPVPIDGANNGWQHLAAMSKDEEAGELVSLIDSEIQKDFYLAVAKELRRLKPAWFKRKKMQMKHIRKGIVKRGAMTRAYSAGIKKIASNMWEDCHAEGYTNLYGITEEDCLLLATNVVVAVNQVCRGPLRVMKYLQKLVLRELAKSGKNKITWVTPSGFVVIYAAYFRRELRHRGTIRGLPASKDGRINHVFLQEVLSKHTGEKLPDLKSFAAGISPNFVHSMDAAHMHKVMATHKGPFAGIHDSFATLSSQVHELKVLTRELFVQQYPHEENFLEKIRYMLSSDPIDMKDLEPELGTLNIEDVRNSRYFFA
jgi:hypothetical protein